MPQVHTAASTLPDLSHGSILNALPDPVLVIDGNGKVAYVNPAGEQFLSSSASTLARQTLADLVPFGSPLLSLVETVRVEGRVMSEYEIDIGTPKIGFQSANIHVTPITDVPGHVLVRIEPRSLASTLDDQLSHRGAARSVSGMVAVMAHEVKNPLSGIRGAAQLLEQSAVPEDRELTQLICSETDRICALVDRMELFSDTGPLERHPVNIHRVLDHVRKLAEHGFASHAQFQTDYDPSLPKVLGDRDALIQVFLNLVKNAAEAVPVSGGRITLSTAYRHGVRLAIPGTGERVLLPLEVAVLDNGDGIPEEIRAHMFDPFVTGKPTGNGLGLALVAKIIGDHGGTITCESEPRRTVFRIRLPMAAE